MSLIAAPKLPASATRPLWLLLAAMRSLSSMMFVFDLASCCAAAAAALSALDGSARASPCDVCDSAAPSALGLLTSTAPSCEPPVLVSGACALVVVVTAGGCVVASVFADEGAAVVVVVVVDVVVVDVEVDVVVVVAGASDASVVDMSAGICGDSVSVGCTMAPAGIGDESAGTSSTELESALCDEARCCCCCASCCSNSVRSMYSVTTVGLISWMVDNCVLVPL